jgi:hypothetical protein
LAGLGATVHEHHGDPAQIDRALKLLQESKPVQTDQSPDVRMGLIFVDVAGRPILSVYVDGLGLYGQVDGSNVVYNNTRFADDLRTAFDPTYDARVL